jgi:hypothetical protein
MRFVSCSAAVAASLFLLSPTAQAVTQLGNFTGWQVFGVSGDTDTSAYPDITYQVSTYSGFKVIKFTLAQPLDLRLDLAWLDTTGLVSGSVGMSGTEIDAIVDFSLRAANGSIVAPTPGPTYFHASKLVVSNYGTIPVPGTTPGLPNSLAYKTQEQSTAQLYKALPAGDYTVTALVSRQSYAGTSIPGLYPKAEVGLYTGPATDFATYQTALAAPINLGASTVVAGDLTASGITTTTGPNPPPNPVPTPCPVVYTVTSSKSLTFNASVTVSNPGSTPETGWTVNGSFSSAALLYSPKNAKLSQKAGYKTFTATPVAANTTIAAGGSTTFTFSGSKGSALPTLTGLTLSAGGKTCTAVPVTP